MHHDTFVQICGTTPRVNHRVNYGHWVIMMHQCMFINYNKCSTLVGDEDNEGMYAHVEAGCIWDISVPSSQCYYEHKIDLKN